MTEEDLLTALLQVKQGLKSLLHLVRAAQLQHLPCTGLEHKEIFLTGTDLQNIWKR